MPILEDFCHDKEPIGKISHSDGEHFHFVWPSQGLVEASKDEKTLDSYKANGEEMVVMVHVLRHVQYRYSNGIELKKIFQQLMQLMRPLREQVVM